MLSNSVLDELIQVKAERDALIQGMLALTREFAAQLVVLAGRDASAAQAGESKQDSCWSVIDGA